MLTSIIELLLICVCSLNFLPHLTIVWALTQPAPWYSGVPLVLWFLNFPQSGNAFQAPLYRVEPKAHCCSKKQFCDSCTTYACQSPHHPLSSPKAGIQILWSSPAVARQFEKNHRKGKVTASVVMCSPPSPQHFWSLYWIVCGLLSFSFLTMKIQNFFSFPGLPSWIPLSHPQDMTLPSSLRTFFPLGQIFLTCDIPACIHL